MAIRFHLPREASERIAFAYSPVLETVQSLHVLVEPKHHPLQHAWVREMRQLPARLRGEIADFSFLYRWNLPDFLFPDPRSEFADFEADLERLRSLDGVEAALEFLRPIYDHGGRRDAGLLADDALRRDVLARTRECHGSAAAELVALVFDDPDELSRRFARLLTAYWKGGFASEWARIEPRLAEAVSEAGRAIAAGGPYAVLGALGPRLLADRERETLTFELPHEHDIVIGEGDELVLAPSVYVWPHVRVNCDPPWPVGVVYAPGFVAGAARPPIPPGELIRLLKAISDDTRLRALALIAERPRSTQELAPLLSISEAGLSKHLRRLADAGVVQTKREGYYVVYNLVRERIEPLTDSVLGFVESGPG